MSDSNAPNDELGASPQLVAALFCRDVIYDESRDEVSLIRIYESFTPTATPRPDARGAHLQDDFWFFVMMDGMPQLMENPDDPEEEPPKEMAITLQLTYPSGDVGFTGHMFMYPEGSLGRATTQIGFSLPLDQVGPLRVDVSYLGRHLTTATLIVRPGSHQLALEIEH